MAKSKNFSKASVYFQKKKEANRRKNRAARTMRQANRKRL